MAAGMSLDVQLIEPKQTASAQALHSKALANSFAELTKGYLNLFNELVAMLERIPQKPNLYEELIVWRPIDHREYFQRCEFAGRKSALEAYEDFSPFFRKRFEALVQELELIALASVAAVRGLFHEGTPEDLSRVTIVCRRASIKMRSILRRASRLVTYGNYFEER